MGTQFTRKDSLVVCINSANFFHPNFELIEGKTYIVYDVIVRPSLLGKAEMKLVFQANDGSIVELSSKRFKRID
jgi:hypothetical protein